ncbi:hypothetical protein PR202_gb16028 [Eleusine coracana subsp. coracana]|uniref:Pentatricopeptide repeat-containing protein n=1 Tax=Eleusine coracana subsp. coracana TaxID=191504 RepID=A0AAV5F0Q5_ELECO|nr:hypothetical protein PR202_gb16028 [Eleusine coracana subsp. coracana]
MPLAVPPALPRAAALVQQYTSLVRAGAASSPPSLRSLLRIHASAVVLGIFGDPAFATSLVNAAAAADSLPYARRVFDAAPSRDAYMWNTLLRVHARVPDSAADALALYKQMRAAGVVPDHYTYPIVLSALIAMYCQEGAVADAEKVFVESGSDGSRTVVLWTAMVAGYAQNCLFSEAIAVFGNMVSQGVLPNEITLISFLPCLHGQDWLAAGQMVHGFVVKLGYDANVPLVNALIAMYSKCGRMAMAEALFNGMTVRSLISWNTMVAMHEQYGDAIRAIKFFHRMLTEKAGFDCVTLVSVLSACAQSGALETGKWVHEFARSHGLDTDARIGNILVDMYAKCGEIADAREVFDSLRERNYLSTQHMNTVNGHLW